MPRTTKPPAYRLYKRPGQAIVTLGGRDYYLGVHGTKVSRDAYDRLVGEWLSAGRSLPGSNGDLSVSELLAAYWRFAKGYYTSSPAELDKIKLAFSHVKRLYGRASATGFGPVALRAVRERLIATGMGRSYVNDQISRIKRAFRWACERELIAPSVHHGLEALTGLRRGRTQAPESTPVLPVPDEFVDAVEPYVSRPVWAIIQLQRLCGARPGELLIMRGCDLDTSGAIWLYRPQAHKTQRFGHARAIELGPRAKKIVKSFLTPDLNAYLFSPATADAERRSALNARRRTPLGYGNRPGSNRKRHPKRKPGDRYTTDTYRRAIQRACDLADAKAREELPAGQRDKRVIPKWHPHQLRHNFGTTVRKEYGLEIARVLLGHKSAVITELYSEFDRAKARNAVAKIG